MFLTEQRRRSQDPEAFPTTQLFILALVRVAEPIALTSIFPYAWKLVLNFNIGDESNGAFYAGILIAAFSLAEALTGMHWGALSDKVGRKPVLLFGCAGTLLSLLIVGFSQNFWIALGGRILGGLLNGNIGVIQTMVGELVKKPEHEPKAYAIMPFVWSIGTIIGPSVGGCLAEPAAAYPSLFAGTIFETFPYLLPNLICAALMLLAIVAGYFFLVETHPDMQPWSTQEELDNTNAQTPLLPTTGTTAHAPANLADESYGTFDIVETNNTDENHWKVHADGRLSSPNLDSHEKVFTKKVIMFTAALGIFCYHSMTYDHLLPIFAQDQRFDVGRISAFSNRSPLAGGLGLTVQQVGVIMSVNGIIALFMQAIVFPWMAAWLGVWKLFILITIGHPLAYVAVPALVVLPPQWLYPGMYACLAIRNFFNILAYPLFLILIKEAAPSPSHLGKINGLAASVGAAARTVASPIAGFLYGVGVQIDFTALAWWASAAVALVGALQIPFMRRKKHRDATVRPLAPCRLYPQAQENAEDKEVVHIFVVDSDDEENNAE